MIKFFRGPAASFNQTDHKDGLYFAIDKGEIYLNDSVYGSEYTITDVQISEDGTSLVISYREHDDKVINLTELLAKASSIADGLMSKEDKINLDKLATAYANDELGKVQGVVDGDKILSMNEKLVAATLNLKYENKKIQLLGINDAVIAEIDASDFVKDSVLDNVEIVTDNGVKYIEFTWAVQDGAEAKTDRIAVADLASEYVEGLGITISDADEIAVKVAAVEGNFLEVDANGLGVYEVTANAAVLQKPITVAGLSGKLGTGNYENGDVIPAGTSIYTILENLLSQELYPTGAKVNTNANLTSKFAAPSFTLTNSGKTVEVGTSATVSAETGYNPTATPTSRTYTGFTNGYSETYGESASIVAGNPASVSVESVELNPGTFKLTRTYSGFGLSGDALISESSANKASDCSIAEDSSLIVAEGANKVTFKMEGPGHSGVAAASPIYYIASNLGNTISTKFVAAKDEELFDIETATAGTASLTVTGAYAYYIGYASSVPTTSDEIKALNEFVGLLSGSSVTIADGGTLPAGKSMCICVPTAYKLNSILNGFNLESKDSFGETNVMYKLPNNVEVEYTIYAMSSAADWNYGAIVLSK